jgi:hypothetical protein
MWRNGLYRFVSCVLQPLCLFSTPPPLPPSLLWRGGGWLTITSQLSIRSSVHMYKPGDGNI